MKYGQRKQMKWIINVALIMCVSLMAPHITQAQDAAADAAVESSTEQVEAGSETFGFSNFWDLTEQAGWFRWFILGVLVIGLFLIIKQCFELWDDRRRGAKLIGMRIGELTVDRLEARVMDESNHMLARLMATLLNVYRSSGVAIMLHEEMANFIHMEQERFSTFKQRIDFLSDSAGAFGLLGTVWGIFLVFSQRDLDPQNILGGMGLALITTLLGLVVSIILNLCLTEVSNIFTRRLDTVAAKADELRFRLMKDSGEMAQVTAAQIAARHADTVLMPSSGMHGGTNGHGGASAPQGRVRTAVARPPAKLSRLGNNQSAPAGQPLPGNIGVQIFDENGQVMPGVRVHFAVKGGDGTLEGDNKKILRETDGSGIAEVQFVLGSEPGFNRVAAKVDGVETRLEFQAMGVEA